MAAALLAVVAAGSAQAEPSGYVPMPPTDISEKEQAEIKKRGEIGRICDLIETHAQANSLPEAFFARLLWKESRFDAGAVSPAGAEGIAQFMPGTAAMRGLADSFDIAQALPASATYLAELRRKYGNLGLAAAAYNSGEGRVSRWLASGGFLPIETENYVLDILGAPADSFIGAKDGQQAPLHPQKSFTEACRELPIIRFNTTPMSRILNKPWAVQLAVNFNRAAVARQLEQTRRKARSLFEGKEVAISRVRTPRGRRGIYVARVGLDAHKEANAVCQQLRSSGGACIVLRNR